VAQHQSQCSIFANQQVYLTFFSVCAVFGRSLPGFRSVADPRSSTRLQIAFTEQSFQPFSGNFATIIVRYPKPSFRNVSIRALSLCDILPITKDRPNCDYDLNIETLKNVLQCLHVNVQIMTSQQRWYHVAQLI